MKYILMISLIVLLTNSVFSQQQELDEFLFGTFSYSPDNNTNYSNYNQIKEMGINSIYQTARRYIPSIQQQSNLDQLSQFKYIYAANSFPGDPNYPNFEQEKVDWIYYFSNAMYSKWEAEGDSKFNYNIKIKHNQTGNYTSGEAYTDYDGTTGWKSNQNSQPGDSLVYGPHYYQYPTYVYGSIDISIPIKYISNFRLRRGTYIPQEAAVVCTLQVLRGYHKVYEVSPGNWVADWIQEKVLKDTVLTTADLTENYKTITLIYNHGENSTQIKGDGNILPLTNTLPQKNADSSAFLLAGTSVQYKVIWSGSAPLYVDYIEVYDEKIWKFFFKENPLVLESRITQYISKFQNENPLFMNKLKYWATIDEPHSLDCYYPIAKLQEILDEQNAQQQLLTHYYPGYNLLRDMDSTFMHWMNIAKPKRLMYWFFPYLVNPDGSYYPDTKGLDLLRNSLQAASTYADTFFVALQTWGYLPNGSSNYYWLRPPTPSQLSAETMLTLAHGVKGFFYEIYYSQKSKLLWLPYPHDVFIVGMVDTLSNSVYPKRDIWYKGQEIGLRLNGTLGKTLLALNYTGKYLLLRQGIDITGTGNFAGDYISLQSTANPCNLHAGLFTKAGLNDGDHYYFLLTNQLTTNSTNVNVTVKPKTTGFTNIRFRNIEHSNNFDITFTGQTTQSLTLPAGEGHLYQVAPVVKYGGKLVYNDTIKTNTTLIDNMTIASGKVLQINSGKYYTLADTVNFENATSFITGEGYLDRSSGGWIIIKSWDKSVFKGKEGSHPKIIWSKHPDISNVIDYKIYRNYASEGWQFLTSKNGNIFEFVDTSIIIIEGYPQANEVTTEYRVTATYKPSKFVIETSPSNTINYHRVEGQGLEKQNPGSTINDFTYYLDQNYPNPFNPITTINYSLAANGFVELEVIDIIGKRVAVLVNEFQTKGNHNISFDASTLASGVYVYKMQSGSFTASKKLVLLK